MFDLALPRPACATKGGTGFTGGCWEGEWLWGAVLRPGSSLHSWFTVTSPGTLRVVVQLKSGNKTVEMFAALALPSLWLGPPWGSCPNCCK